MEQNKSKPAGELYIRPHMKLFPFAEGSERYSIPLEEVQPLPAPRRIQANATPPSWGHLWKNPNNGVMLGVPSVPEVPVISEVSVPKPTEPAFGFLEEASKVMKQRAELRDQKGGERSMEAIVNMFAAYKGEGWDGKMSEEDGWVFMIILKLVRGSHGFYNRDDYVDGAAYFGLLGESASKHMPRKG